MSSTPIAQWPVQLQSIVAQLNSAQMMDCSYLRGRAWEIIQMSVVGYARFHTHRLGALSAAELADIAAEKSLDLLLRVDSGLWRPDEESPGQVRAFLSTVARNAVVDILRANGRTIRVADPKESAVSGGNVVMLQQPMPTPLGEMAAADFVSCLYDCVATLAPRARRLWFFRVLYEMPSKQIANHPDVKMNAANVDVALRRCRQKIGHCMDAKEMKLKSLPPGTFSALWQLCLRDNGELQKEVGHG